MSRDPQARLAVGRDQFNLAWDPKDAPVGSVNDGAEVEFDLLDSSGGQLGPESSADDLRNLDFGRVDQIHGPVLVEGASVGDALEVEFLDFKCDRWGWTASIPGFGLLADDFEAPAFRVSRLDGDDEVEFLPGIRVPLDPFCGVVGVSPSAGPLGTIPPGPHGGNMDTRHMTQGARLLLPVFVEGALLSLGDGHAAQGDGEVCGTAIETPMRTLVRIHVRKGLRLRGPEFLAPARKRPDGAAYATDGIGPDVREAARDATRRMIDWLAREHHVNPIDAYLLCSVAVDLRISEIVDEPNFIVTAYCPLAIFR